MRSTSSDPTGDAIANYSGLFASPPQVNEPAADLTSVVIRPTTHPTGGFDVTMRVASLSPANLNKALADTNSRSLLYVLWFGDGYQVSAVIARYSATTQAWTFKYNNYDALLSDCVAPPSTSGDRCLAFGANGTTTRGTVDAATGTITMTAPRRYPGGRIFLYGLQGGTGDQQRPRQVLATSGTRFYDAAAFTFGDPLDRPTDVKITQSYLYPLDNTPAMDFLLP